MHPHAILQEFGHFFGAALDINLGYSILLRLGYFSDKLIRKWVDNEKLRIIPAMAETESFDEGVFTETLDGLELKYKNRIQISNYVAICWALVSVVLILIILAFAPFSDYAVGHCQAFVMESLLAAATPVGLAAFATLHGCALGEMRKSTHEFDNVMKYRKRATEEKINQVRAELQAKLQQSRNVAA